MNQSQWRAGIALTFALFFMSGCGVNTKEKSTSSPQQILIKAEDALSKVGVELDSNTGKLTHCQSEYQRTCTARTQAIKKYIDKAFAIYGTEDQMPEALLAKVKTLSACMTQLNADLANTNSTNCKI